MRRDAHEREHVADGLVSEHLLVSDRAHAAVGQRRGHHRARLARHFDRAHLQASKGHSVLAVANEY